MHATLEPTDTAPQYTPVPDSFAERVLLLLARNPEEEYASADLALKLDGKTNSVQPLLAAALQHNLVTFSAAEGDRCKYWRAGPGLAQWYARRLATAEAAAQARGLALRQQDQPAADPTPARKGRGGRQVQLPPLVPSAVAFHPGGREKPQTTRMGPGGIRVSRYEWVFERLHAQPVGASAVLPAQYLGTIKAAAKKRQQKGLGKYTVLRISLTNMEIWRDA